MDDWLSTGAAAHLLGTTTTTIRAMALRGELQYETEPRGSRARWRISAWSADAWLSENGRVDQRRHAKSDSAHPHLGGNVEPSYRELQAELLRVRAARDALIDEVATLRAVALHLRARNEAVATAESHQASAGRLLAQALEEQAIAADELRRAVSAQDDALGQFLVQGPPRLG